MVLCASNRHLHRTEPPLQPYTARDHFMGEKTQVRKGKASSGVTAAKRWSRDLNLGSLSLDPEPSTALSSVPAEMHPRGLLRVEDGPSFTEAS